MHLRSLTLAGFKSFARKTSLEFESSIVAVVGPNGSGKSNVAEAFRFVLGEQSMKSMRGKRGEDLIFAGTGAAPKVNAGSVLLTFDNRGRGPKKLFPTIDFDEVTLERTVYRDGINEYKLNGSSVRLRDIQETLAGANIGASGHHIISQGEADRILNASITERREMIEDALSLKIYHYKKDESERKLAKTEENLEKAAAIRREIAPHLRFLEKQVEKLQKAEDLRSELREVYREYLKREETHLSEEAERIKDTRAPLDTEKKSADVRLAEIETRLEKEKGSTREKELLSYEQELTRLEERREKLLREQGAIEGELRAETRARERLAKEASSSASVSFSDVEKLSVQIDSLASEASDSTDVGALRALLERIKSAFRTFLEEQRRGHSFDRTKESEDHFNFLKEKLAALTKDLSVADAEVEVTRKKIADIRGAIAKEAHSSREIEREMFTLLNRRTELSVALSELDAAFRARDTRDLAFKNELREAQALLGLEVLHYKDVTTPKEESALQEERRKKLEKMKIRLEEMGGGGGGEVMKEYGEVKEREAFYAKEIADLEKSVEDLQVVIKELEEKLEAEFKTGVAKINEEFKKFFVMMFGGGQASLSVISQPKRRRKVAEEDMDGTEVEPEAEEGVDITVSLPGKRTKGLDMLSGGERALTSIALLFAISEVNAPPFIILDETDAALDESNSRKYGDMVENLSKNSQLIVITHNRETMSRAGILYGVTMGGDGVSKLLSIKFDEAVAVAK